jgi:hypothetical protein
VGLEALEDRTVPSLFNAPLIANLPDSPDAVATGHFRGPNAPLDAVTINRHGTLSVLLGNGDGSFQSPVNINVDGSFFTHSLAVGDLLGNGIQDIVTSNGRTVQVLLGNGDGSFQAPQTVEVVPLGVGDVTLGDFLGNGRQDILTVEHGRVSVLLSNGDGTFQAPVDTPISGVEYTHFHQVAVGDFNHDGKPGLAVAAPNGVEILRGNGDATFSLENTITFGINSFDHSVVGATEVQTADLLGNGQTDVVAVTGDNVIPGPTPDVRLLLGNGDGTFQDPVTLREPGYNITTEGPFDIVDHVAVGNFTGHGRLDIVTFNFGTYLSSPPFINAPNFDVWVNNGDGTFHNLGAKAVGGQQFLQGAGDFRGTGTLDLVSLGNKSATVLLNNGDGTFNFAPTVATGSVDPVAMVNADFTGRGRPQDLAVAGPGGSVSVLLSTGDGTFRAPVTFSPPGLGAPSLDGLAVGDFLGNGKQDIAVAVTDIYNGQTSVFIFLGNGDGTFQQTPLTLATGFISDGPHSLIARDLNGDGRADLILTSSAALSVSLSNGDGTFAAPVTFNLGATPTDVAVADLRGNGKLDLIATTPAAGGQSTVKVLLGNGDGTFAAPVTVFTGAGSRLAVGDFLGNNRLDILTYTTGGTLNVLLNNGDGTFGNAVTTTTGISLGGVAVGDFVGNGHLGLAFTATDAGGAVVLRGTGEGTFQVAGGFLTGPRDPLALVAGDFNGDGKLDLIVGDSEVGGFGTAAITVLLNQGGEAAATATTLTADASTVTFGQPVTLTATVTSPAGTPTGTVTFFDGGVPLGSAALDANGQATLVVQLGGGDHSLTAAFAGGGAFAASTSSALAETVSKADTTTTLAADATTVTFGQPVTLTATVTSPAGTPAGTVTFFDGDTVLGTVTLDAKGQASLVVELGPGSHALTASFDGTGDFAASKSADLDETVTKADTTAVLATDSNTIVNGQSVTLTVSITGAPGAGTPTGTVTFFDGATVLGTAQLDANGQAVLIVNDLTPGEHSLTASYGGDDSYLASTSDSFTLTVT